MLCFKYGLFWYWDSESSLLAVYCNNCGLSRTGMLGDGFGALFLKVGGYKGLSFLANSGCSNFLSNISYTEIIVIGGTVFTIYRSTKLLIKCSRSMYRFIEKKFTSKLNSKQLVRFLSEYLIESFSMDRVYRIYYVALQL
uniref:Uncharacterized protein n=1 Tax=Nitzschia supralitorea TaxID=303403 RepID=A0A8F1B779_9STRA|nr:hypothetical protein KYU99_pgp066 [Nitzschia supralitorea]QWM93177.1 hypothetical protein [Nitzschia supralitorea]